MTEDKVVGLRWSKGAVAYIHHIHAVAHRGKLLCDDHALPETLVLAESGMIFTQMKRAREINKQSAARGSLPGCGEHGL